MAGIVNDLREEHQSFGKLFDILEHQLKIFQNDQTPDYQLIGEVIDLIFHFPHLYHHPKEDAIFDKLARRDPSAASSLPDIKHEHGQLHDLARQFASNIERVISEAEIPREQVIKKLRELTELQRRHMQMEEEIFLPTALKTLTQEDWNELDARVADPDDPAFGAEAKLKYLDQYEKAMPSP